MELALDPELVTGLLLATVRAGAFVTATPVFPLPTSGRLAMTIALGWFLAEPTSGTLGLAGMLGAVLVNVAIGWALGFLTAVPFAAFSTAGGLLDAMSGLQISSTFDPIQGTSASVFGRLFSLTAAMFFLTIGGLRLLVEGLSLSIDRIGLDGGIVLDGSLATFLFDLTRVMFVAAIELALPAIAALFVAEVVIALSSRFAPQANLFILGLPLRILIALFGASAILMLFPETAQGLMRVMREAIVMGLRGLGG